MLKEIIEKLNSRTDDVPSDFNFVVKEENGKIYIYDKNENYNINYQDKLDDMAYEIEQEFGKKIYFEDNIIKKLESAVKNDYGEDAYIDWEDPIRMIISK